MIRQFVCLRFRRCNLGHVLAKSRRSTGKLAVSTQHRSMWKAEQIKERVLPSGLAIPPLTRLRAGSSGMAETYHFSQREMARKPLMQEYRAVGKIPGHGAYRCVLI